MADRYIIVTDLNKRVRQFLRRELEAVGHLVAEARDEAELFVLLAGGRAKLVVLDPAIASQENPSAPGGILETLRREKPELPVILHAFAGEDRADGAEPGLWINKNGDIDRLMGVVARLLAAT